MRWPPRLTPARVNVALVSLGLVSLALYVLGAAEIRAVPKMGFTATVLALAIPYFAASWLLLKAPPARSTLVIGLLFAAAFRVVGLSTPAELSSDLYRYIWDGKVQAAGINPYMYVPADPHLASLREARLWPPGKPPRINRAKYAHTIYPPVAQAFFLAVTRLGESVTSMRLAMIACEALTLWACGQLLARFGLPVQRVLLYAWHPLAAWEFSSGGHIDALMIALTALAFLAAGRRNPAGVGGWLAGATLVKLFPIVLFPALWRRWDWKMPAAFATVAAIAYAPYVWSFNLRGVLGFLPGYTTEEGLKSGDRFYLMNLIPGYSTYPIFVALAGLALAGVALWAFFAPLHDQLSPLRRGLALAALFVAILSPGYDWYYTWLIPFLCFLPYAWLFWFTSSAFVLYLNWDWFALSDAYLQNSFIYLPAALLALHSLLRRRSLAS